jgi:hypothetical protein
LDLIFFAEILPALNQPVRTYPLRVVNEPSVYISGDKMGQKVYPPGSGVMHGVPPPVPPMQQPGMPMNFSQQQAMVAQQNNNMEMLERRREQERARNQSSNTGAVGADVHPRSFCSNAFIASTTFGR